MYRSTFTTFTFFRFYARHRLVSFQIANACVVHWTRCHDFNTIGKCVRIWSKSQLETVNLRVRLFYFTYTLPHCVYSQLLSWLVCRNKTELTRWLSNFLIHVDTSHFGELSSRVQIISVKSPYAWLHNAVELIRNLYYFWHIQASCADIERTKSVKTNAPLFFLIK